MVIKIAIPAAIAAFGLWFLFGRSADHPKRPISRVLCAMPFFIAAALAASAFALPVGSDARVAVVILAFVMVIGGGTVFGWLGAVLDSWKGGPDDWQDFGAWGAFVFLNLILPIIIFAVIELLYFN